MPASHYRLMGRDGDLSDGQKTLLRGGWGHVLGDSVPTYGVNIQLSRLYPMPCPTYSDPHPTSSAHSLGAVSEVAAAGVIGTGTHNTGIKHGILPTQVSHSVSVWMLGSEGYEGCVPLSHHLVWG